MSNLITLKLEMLKNHNQNDTNDDITYLKKNHDRLIICNSNSAVDTITATKQSK